MSDMAEDFKAHREAWQAKRKHNREASIDVLRQHGVTFETKHGYAHLIVEHHGSVVYFWPGTGRFIFRGAGGRNGRGVFALLKDLGIQRLADRPSVEKSNNSQQGT